MQVEKKIRGDERYILYRYMVEKGRRNSGMNMNGGGGKELRRKVTKSECDGIERKQKILMEKEKDIEWDG